jgi:hypothetical protein
VAGGRTLALARLLGRDQRAYRTVRRENVARYLLVRLNREGRGTRVEFYPLNLSQVSRSRQCEVSYRTLNVRHWDRIVARRRPGPGGMGGGRRGRPRLGMGLGSFVWIIRSLVRVCR